MYIVDCSGDSNNAEVTESCDEPVGAYDTKRISSPDKIDLVQSVHFNIDLHNLVCNSWGLTAANII